VGRGEIGGVYYFSYTLIDSPCLIVIYLTR
jgi:hypothetical protein